MLICKVSIAMLCCAKALHIAMQVALGCASARTAVRLQNVRPLRAGALQCMLGRRPAPAAGPRAPARCRAALAKALTEESELTEVPEPEDARGAIAVGLKLYNAGQHSAALDIFVKALELPGTGLKRFRSGQLLSMCYHCSVTEG